MNVIVVGSPWPLSFGSRHLGVGIVLRDKRIGGFHDTRCVYLMIILCDLNPGRLPGQSLSVADSPLLPAKIEEIHEYFRYRCSLYKEPTKMDAEIKVQTSRHTRESSGKQVCHVLRAHDRNLRLKTAYHM